MHFGFLKAGAIVAQRFAVEEHVGSGGMGMVFRARDLSTGNQVALKLLLSQASDPQEEERFAREAQVLAELRHPGIVAYVAHGRTSEGQPFLAMEWLEGIDLAQRLRQGSLSLAECMVLLRKTASALAAAHRRGIIHRDLKPSNLVLRGGQVERVAILDFGIARQAFGNRTMTRTGLVIGTPEYMAPEQARGQRDIGPTADIFSLGCMLYECLAGQPPFTGAHMAAQLAKILFEEATPIRQIRGAVPPPIEALLMRMLAKLPEKRPKDAEALLAELDGLDGLELDPEAILALTPGRVRTTLAGSEQQLVSVVLGALRKSLNEGLPTLGNDDVEQVRTQRMGLASSLMVYGMQLEWLADGSLVATLINAGSATDQAEQAARYALALQERWPEALVALATGRGVLHQTLPVGDAIDRCVALLRARATLSPSSTLLGEHSVNEGVWLDEVTAGLLDGRFQVTRVDQYAVLPGERVSADQTRLLLGKPTPCVGREQELAVLDVVLSGCISDSTARAVLVTAPAGLGKSRLRHEFLRRLESRGQEITVMIGRGDPMTAGSPYAMLAEALRRECGVQSGEALEQQRTKLHERLAQNLPAAESTRIIEFLGELCGVCFPDDDSVLLRAARQDPKIMSEQVNQAFVDFLRAESELRPLLLILEDLHWGDMLTVKLVDTALRDLADRPLLVLTLARPEASKLFPALWEERGLQEIRLTALNKKASERLVTQVLGNRIHPATLSRIVEQASGNALFLEELIRAVAEGKGDELPETVLAMVQARLLRLEPAARRVLRAASIFGETFWVGGVQSLSVSGSQTKRNSNHDTQELNSWLRVLVEAEAIERHRESRFPEETEYGFRHALVREAAYSMLTEDDRRLGHLLAGRYLETAGERDPMVLAEHFRRASDNARATPHYLRAADQSYDSNDLEGACMRAERGVACEASGEALGSLRVLQMLVHVWRTQWDTAYRYGTEALALLPPGSYRWCKAMGHMLGISAMMSQPDPAAVGNLVNSFITTNPTDAARGAYIEAASIVLTMFSWAGHRSAARYLKTRMDDIGNPIIEHDATARGWLNFSHGSYMHMMEPDPAEAVRCSTIACQSFKQAGDGRNQVFSQALLGQTLYALGRIQEGQATLRQGLALAERLGEAYTIVWARIYLALMLTQHTERSLLQEAQAIAKETLQSRDLIAAFRGWAHNILARVLLLDGHLDEAQAEAEQGRAVLIIAPMWQLASIETLIRIKLQKNEAMAALKLAEQVLTHLQSVGGAGHIEVAVRLAIAESFLAAERYDAAWQALRDGRLLVEQRASSIIDATDRGCFLTKVAENAQILSLAQRWLPVH